MSSKKRKKDFNEEPTSNPIPTETPSGNEELAITNPIVPTEPPTASNAITKFFGRYDLQAIIIFLISFVIYSNTLNHSYAVDDAIVITRNAFTRKGIKGMHGIWTEDTFVGFFGKQQLLVSGGRYRPLSLATFALEIAMFGDYAKDAKGDYIMDPKTPTEHLKDKDGDYVYDGSPFISHLCTVLFYGWLCIVVYFLMLQLFNPRRDPGALLANFMAFAAALLYATHPVHTEAVANIKGRDEILVTLGAVLALYWTLKAAASETSTSKILYMVGAMIGFFIGIFSKESAITFLAVIPAALYFFMPKVTYKEMAFYTTPFLVATVVFWFGIRQPILHMDTTNDPMAKILEKLSQDMYKNHKSYFFWIKDEPTELMNNPFLKLQKGQYVPYTDNERMGTILYTWLEYFRILAYPHPLTNDYYPRHIPIQDADTLKSLVIPTFSMPRVQLALFLHIFLIGVGIWAFIKRKPIGFCILYYFATFSVVSNMFFPIGTNMAERFMFMPSLGFSIACALGLAYLAKRANMNAALAVLAITTALYSIKTYSRNFAWKDDYTLFTTDIEVSKNSAKLNNAVSGVLQDFLYLKTTPAEKEESLKKAIGHSLRAITMHPTYNNAWLLYGNANVLYANMRLVRADSMRATNPQSATLEYENIQKLYQIGIDAYKEVMRLRPDHPDAPQNLGVTYRDQGKLYGEKMNNIAAAIQSLQNSTKYLPNDPEVYRLLGIGYGVAGQHGNAITALTKSLQLNGNQPSVYYNLEVAYRIMGDNANADQCRATWQKLDPTYKPN